MDMADSELERAAFTHSSIPLLVASSERIVLTVNDAMKRLLTPWLRRRRRSTGMTNLLRFNVSAMNEDEFDDLNEDWLVGLSLSDIPISSLDGSQSAMELLDDFMDRLREKTFDSPDRLADTSSEGLFPPHSAADYQVVVARRDSTRCLDLDNRVFQMTSATEATLTITTWGFNAAVFYTLMLTRPSTELRRSSSSTIRNSPRSGQNPKPPFLWHTHAHSQGRREPPAESLPDTNITSRDRSPYSSGQVQTNIFNRPALDRSQSYNQSDSIVRPTFSRASTYGQCSSRGNNVRGRVRAASILASPSRETISRSISAAESWASHSSQPWEDKFAALKEAIYYNSASPGFILSADETFAYPSYRRGEKTQPVEINDVRAYFDGWNAWDETFSRRLQFEELPVIWLSRNRKNFKGRRLGLWREGKRVLFEVRGECLYDFRGEYVGGVVWVEELGVFEEVIEKEKQERLRNFETICDSLPHVVFTATAEGNVDYFSKKWYEFSGLSPSESLGTGYRSIVHPEDKHKLFETHVRAIDTRDEAETHARYFRKDGVWRWHNARCKPLKDRGDQILKWYGTLTDVDEIITARLESKELEDENSRLHAQERAASESSRMKSQFLAHMSHELRTPIAGIIGMIGLLCDTVLTPDQQEYAESVRISANNLLTIVNDILDFSKTESGRLQIEETVFSLANLIDDVHRVWSHVSHQKALLFITDSQVPASLQVRGDPGRIFQILSNLLNNGLKFTSQGSITFRIRILETEPIANIQFEVEDTGIGIESSILSTLFTPFNQGDASTARIFGGTGLGLAISRSLAEMMGGQLRLESTPAVGTRALLDLPLRIMRGDSAACSHPANDSGSTTDGKRSSFPFTVESSHELDFSESAHGSPMPASNASTPLIGVSSSRKDITVLVVEDNTINQRIAVKSCAKLGFATAAVSNGQEALDYIAAGNAVDICLMDCQMPILDGYEATRRLRNEEPFVSLRIRSEPSTPRELPIAFRQVRKLKDLPIIALTASAISGDRERCFEAGMDDYLTKPLNTQQLEEKLCKWAFPRAKDPDTRS